LNLLGAGLRDAWTPRKTDDPAAGVADLTVRFRTEDGPVLAVDTASFTWLSRSVVALVGESGCGKERAALALTGLFARQSFVSGVGAVDGRSWWGSRG